MYIILFFCMNKGHYSLKVQTQWIHLQISSQAYSFSIDSRRSMMDMPQFTDQWANLNLHKHKLPSTLGK